MCGICGIYHVDSAQPVDGALLQRMNQTLVHRGPDSDGFWLQANLGMAMRRLAIIDVATGGQPISNEDGSIVLTFNGEIYNYRELTAELKDLGHHFKTSSDTETIVHAYEQWGDEALLRFNGMFAIALWDGRDARLLLARDRMGKKPLYWHYGAQGLVWGSEAKALLAIPWIDQHLNPVALHHYLTLQYAPNPLTFYQHVHQLPAAHKLILPFGSTPQVSRYWQLAFEPKWSLSDEDAVAQARHLLSQAVTRRLVSEVPLGAFLSGGIDSSIIVALMSALSASPVKTFSIGFEERHFSEAPYARRVAERYHTEHHEFIFRPRDLVGLIESVLAATDEPLADPAALPLYELARQTRPHVTVALCGDGGDETLAGYQRYSLDRWLQPLTLLPRWLTRTALPALLKHLPDVAWLPEDRSPIAGLKRLGQFASVTPKASLVRWGSYFSHDDKLALYTDAWREIFTEENTADLIASEYDQAQASGLLDGTLYTDHVTYLSGDLLPKTDRMTMAHSVEARAPLLDADWVEWTARLPERFKLRGWSNKWLLHQAFKPELPPEINRRGKQGFSLPVGLWLRYDLRDWATQRLFGVERMWEWFRPQAVQRLFDEHDSGKINHGKRLWALLVFALWLHRQ